MPTLADIGGAEPSTITFRVATVTQNVNGTVVHKEVLVLGDPDTTNAIAAVLNTAPASTAWALVTRPLGPVSIQGNSTVVVVSGNSSVFQASTVWQVQVTNQTRVSNSTAGDFLAQISGNSTVFQGGAPWSVSQVAGSTWTVRCNNSSAADLLTQISGNSTVVQGTNPWIIAGNSTVAPLAGSTWATRPIQSSQADLRMTAYQSTAADLNVTVAGYSTVVTANIPMQSTAAPSSASSGVIVRQVIDVITSFASTSALASTSVEVASSGAAVRIYVTGYSITSTNQTAAHWGFFSSNATLLWPMTLAAISSGVTGVNLAVSAPAYLFRTTAAEALNFKSAGSTVAGVQMGVSYFKAP